VCYYFIINSKNLPFFLRQGTTKIWNSSLFTKLFFKVFLTFFSAFRERIPRVQSVKYAFQGTCFSSKAGTKVLNVFNKTNFNAFFLILFPPDLPGSFYFLSLYILNRYILHYFSTYKQPRHICLKKSCQNNQKKFLYFK